MDPLVVYGSRPAWGTPDFSPFVIKLETWLRFAGIPYQRRNGNPMQAPKGKIPYIEIDGGKMGDSQLILEELTRRHNILLDQGMSTVEAATARAVRRMLEEGMYFATLRMRWLEDETWDEQYKAFKVMFPAPIAPIVMPLLRRRIRGNAVAQGIGRHTREEAYGMAIADLAAVEEILGDKPYLFGTAPRSVDATVYAFLVAIQNYPVNTSVVAAANAPSLRAYTARIKEKYWPATEMAAGE